MRRPIKPRNAGRVHVTPAELELEDINLLIFGWDDYVPGDKAVLRTEEAFHDFLRRYGAEPRGWHGPHPPGGYNLELELEKTVAWKEAEDPRLTPSIPGLEPPARKQKASKPKRRARPKPQVAAKAAKSKDSKPSPAPEAAKEEAQKPKKEVWFHPQGGSGGSTNPLDEPWPEPFEAGEPD